jgi:hypothetical protein
MHHFRALGLGLLLIAAGAPLSAAPILFEGFDDITTLAGDGWVMINNSSPVGTTGWFQGNTGVFVAQSGAADSYIAANYNNAELGGDIDNWLLTPVLMLDSSTVVSFYTRSTGGGYADRLAVSYSTSGGSTDVANDFTLTLAVNDVLDPYGYPSEWTMYTLNLSSIAAPALGRIAFHYAVPDTLVNADFIGVDSVSVEQVPEPSEAGLMAAGLLALGLWRWRRNCRQAQEEAANV